MTSSSSKSSGVPRNLPGAAVSPGPQSSPGGSPTDTAQPVAARPEVVPPHRYLLFTLIAGIGCYLDLATKRWTFEWRGMPGEQPVWWLWDGLVGIETALNQGSLGGMQLGSPDQSVQLLAVISAIAFVGAIAWFVWGRLGQSLSMTIVLGCICAGILGNLYDRLGLWSLNAEGQPTIRAVRDWIRLSYGEYVWPNFNIADSLLVCATAWLCWSSFRTPAGPGTASQAPPTP